MKVFRLLLAALVAFAPVQAQDTESTLATRSSLQLDGPRFGVTFLDGQLARDLEDMFGAQPLISQFGWQVENQFFTLPNGTSGIVEFVGLLGGFEQGLLLPSATMLVGMRNYRGMEFGFGPNVSLAGASLAFAVGVTVQSYGINFPINLAYVPSANGGRLSFLLGFNAISRPARVPGTRRGLFW